MSSRGGDVSSVGRSLAGNLGGRGLGSRLNGSVALDLDQRSVVVLLVVGGDHDGVVVAGGELGSGGPLVASRVDNRV